MPITWSAAGKLATLGPAVDPLVEIVTDLAERPVSVTSLGATRDFALFGGRVEYDASTGETGRLHLAHVSLPFEGEERIYRHVDALGNVSFTTDENGLVTSHRRYHSFGLDRIYGGGSFSENDPRGFAGGIELQHGGVGTGLVVLGARVLDSDVGRFLSRDPFFDLLNAYTYAYGNPVQYQDRSGRIAAPKGAENQAAALEHQATKLDADAAQAQFEARVLGSVAGGMLALSKKLAPHEPRAAAIAAGLAVGVGALAAARETQAAAYQSDAAKLRLRAAELSAATEGGSGGGGGGGFDEFLIPFDYEAPPPIGWEGPCGPTHAMVEGGSLRMGWLLLTLAVVLSLLRPSAIRSRTRKSDRGREICDPEPARAGDGVR
jgi:RHS repeat-associated protein